jgi:uncharacterized protein with GYD domain
MSKFLIEATYTAEGLQGLKKDKASGRRHAVEQAINALGGKLESMYYAFGNTDVFVMADLPDNATAAAIGLAISGGGSVRTKTTPLLTVEETDQAINKRIDYRAPGR